ncbi:MAG TPA: nuclear transport factor 2 family protein [Kofleriaceae bacterium]|nr:nuclear transport factor 2 family protein [Kofleriaceae bacterium]
MLAACARSAPVAPVEKPADPHQAATDARGLIAEIYQAIGDGQTDSLFSRVAEPIVVFGPRKLDATAGRANVLLALGQQLTAANRAAASKPAKGKPPGHLALRSTALHLVVSPGGHSAWMFDVVNVDGVPLNVTAVLTGTGGVWAVSAAQIALAPTSRIVHDQAARDAVVPPGSAASSKLEPAATEAIDRLKAGLVDQAAWGRDLVGRDDAIVIGPSAGELAIGKDAIDRAWQARLAANTREATSSELTSTRAPDGELAWVSASVTRVADGADPLPLRVFAIYAQDAAGWKLVALHEALAIDEPGAGTQFKAILPPAPVKPEPKPEPKPDDGAATATVTAEPGLDGKKPGKPAKASKTSKASKTAKASKTTKASKTAKASKTTKPSKASKASKPSKATKPAKQPPTPASDAAAAAPP